MNVIEITIIMLATVVASSFIERLCGRRIPLPFIQILLGAALAGLFDFRIELEPELFLLLFIAPLLFLDGWRIPTSGLRRDRGAIVALALGLVLFTVVGVGLFIHWLIPAVPLAIAFALAAVLSPTDAVAVSAISARTPLPGRLMHIIEGEALLNDASGLVCMRFALAAALTGSFSLWQASAAFAWLAVGGLVLGALVTVAANTAKDWIAARFGEETGSQILISILIPFAAYLLANYIGVSGVLAAVAAGIAMNFEELSGRAQPITRIRRSAVWRTIQFALNGIIFILLGDQLPAIVRAAESGAGAIAASDTGGLLLLAAQIYAVLLLLRFLWGWLTLRFLLFRWVRRSGGRKVPAVRLAAITSLAGVRGALTLSGVMAFPLTMLDGSAFPARDLCIALAAGAIILSLLLAYAGLPLLVKGIELPRETRRETQESQARIAAATAAIHAVEDRLEHMAERQGTADAEVEAGARLVAIYRQRIEAREKGASDAEFARQVDRAERQLQIVALRAERDQLYHLARSGDLAEESVRALVREIDLLETRFARH